MKMTLPIRRINTVISALILLALSVVALMTILASSDVLAQEGIKDTTCGVVDGLVGGNSSCDNSTTLEDEIGGTSGGIFQSVTRVLTAVAAGVIVVMFMVGAIRYAASGGNPEKTKAAKNTILYAVVALALLLLAGLIFGLVRSAANTVENGPAGARNITIDFLVSR